MNNRYVIANWKMNLSITDSVQLAKKIKLKFMKEIWQRQVVLCPDFLSLPQISSDLEKSKINLGAQNAFWEDQGSYTGEVSVKELKQLNTDMIILGHSERRNFLKEDSEMINKKISLALKYSITPIVCVGENEVTKKAGKEKAFLRQQIKKTLANIKLKKNQEIILAYEPIWAIGNGKNMSAKEVKEMLVFIKEELVKLYSEKTIKEKFVFIYGGSINAKNIKGMTRYPEIQGVLVGGASLKLNSFISICKTMLE